MEPIESDPHNHLTIRFSDTGSSIGLSGCDELLPFFDSILCGWPHSIHHSKSESEAAFLTIEREGFRYRMTPCQDEKAISFSDPVDLVCAVIVEIAWETLRANPQWLCLHCAAVELDGKLILFPNTRRAGKSTLTAALGLHGSSIFTDDFLAIEADPGRPICGISSGVSVRMRKPWPENVPNSFNELLASSEVTASDRYSYHARHNSMPVKRGRRVPIGGIVLLERGEQASANLDKANRSEILGAMITQNFSRAGNSARILRLLHCLVCEIDSYVLRYSDPVEATVLLQKFFSQTDPEKFCVTPSESGFGQFALPDIKTGPGSNSVIDENARLVRADGITEHEFEGVRFLADPKGYGIHRLDTLSGAVWHVLQEPISANEIVDLFEAAFAETSPERIREDILKLLADLSDAGLVSCQ